MSARVAFLLAALLGSSAAHAQNNSQFVSQSVPAVVASGQTYSVSVTFKNTGTTTWTEAGTYRVGMYKAYPESFVWQAWHTPPPAAVFPGQTTTFTFDIIGPATPGAYAFDWRVVQENLEWFGPISPQIMIPVGTPNAAFVSQNIPSVVQGIPASVSVTLQNTGHIAWIPGQHYLRSESPQGNTNWGIQRVEIPSTVPPGQSVTIGFTVIAAMSGPLDFQWRMADGKATGNPSFGAATPSTSVAVGVDVNAQFVSQTMLTAIAPGQSQAVQVVMRNNGISTWNSGVGFQLASQNPTDNTTWGINRVPLPHDVPPGQTVAFVFNTTAPSSAGAYDFQWKMFHPSTGTFGAPSTNVAINVGPVESTGVSYIHVDHLNTPRAIYDTNQQLRWKWEQQEPFGVNLPDENPSGLGSFEFGFRFPGQHTDRETGLAYNYFRDYDPALGRYLQGDPIGLEVGLNLYEYVESDPLAAIDTDGLAKVRFPKKVPPKPSKPPPTGKDREINPPDKKPGMWNCKARADCNDNMPGNCPDDPWKRFAFGGGFAKDLGTARNIAKSNATHNLGCQPKHVSCVCTGPTGDRYNGGC